MSRPFPRSTSWAIRRRLVPANAGEPSGMPSPELPADLPKRSWLTTLKNTFKEFSEDKLQHWAAALTYYAVLSMFPALLVMVSLVGLVADKQQVTKFLTDVISSLGPASAADTFKGPIQSLTANRGAAGILAIVGVASALWSASGYFGAFTEAANSTYPALLYLVVILAVLYYAAPNARVKGIEWVSVGSIVALVTWIVASVAFAIYVANFGSYNKRLARRRRRLPAVAVDHEHGRALRRGAQRGARAHARGHGGRAGRRGAAQAPGARPAEGGAAPAHRV